MKPGRTKITDVWTDGRTDERRKGGGEEKQANNPQTKTKTKTKRLTFITQREPPQLRVIRKALHTYRRRCLYERYDALTYHRVK